MPIFNIKGEKAGTTEFVGCVLTHPEGERIGFDMYESAVWVWNNTLNLPEQIFVDGIYAKSNKDATPEIIKKYVEYKQTIRERADKRDRCESIIATSKNIRIGDTIKVVKGKKHPIGTTGKAFWCGKNRYGTSIGFKVGDCDEAQWVSYDNAQKVLSPEFEEQVKEAKEFLENC